MEKTLSNGHTMEIKDRGDGKHDLYYDGRWIGWGTDLNEDETKAMKELDDRMIFGIDPYERED